MPAIYLGSIAPFKVSVFKVSATSGTGRSMIYSYKKGRLPQGLEIQPDGQIYGRMKDRVFTIDQGTTTFTGNDSSATSFDTEYYFTVTATDSQKLLSSDQQFMIRVYKDHFAAVANLFSRSYLDGLNPAAFAPLLKISLQWSGVLSAILVTAIQALYQANH